MPLSIDSALGPMPDALILRGRRSEVIASNLANADTPNFKARDFDFQSMMNKARSEQVALNTTHASHIAMNGAGGIGGAPLQYRVPNQPSLDGNSVDLQVEQAAFAENAVNYEATLTFLTSRIKGLMTAIRGD
ncbi:MAG TPA: flagellar basal body rod protein FlgB [Gammaproteobacteria bacterium]|nr:flagellar basal body rod protein FlgB [Gammaproteobacteria bacterium]